MHGFASEPCYKSSSELVVIGTISACVPYWSAYFLFFLCIPLTINHKSSLAISLCLASGNSGFPWPLTPHWNAHGSSAPLGPHSPLPMSLPSWHCKAMFSICWMKSMTGSSIWFQKPQQTNDAQLTFTPQACKRPKRSEAFQLGWTVSLAFRDNIPSRSTQYVLYSSQKHCGLE